MLPHLLKRILGFYLLVQSVFVISVQAASVGYRDEDGTFHELHYKPSQSENNSYALTDAQGNGLPNFFSGKLELNATIEEIAAHAPVIPNISILNRSASPVTPTDPPTPIVNFPIVLEDFPRTWDYKSLNSFLICLLWVEGDKVRTFRVAPFSSYEHRLKVLNSSTTIKFISNPTHPLFPETLDSETSSHRGFPVVVLFENESLVPVHKGKVSYQDLLFTPIEQLSPKHSKEATYAAARYGVAQFFERNPKAIERLSLSKQKDCLEAAIVNGQANIIPLILGPKQINSLDPQNLNSLARYSEKNALLRATRLGHTSTVLAVANSSVPLKDKLKRELVQEAFLHKRLDTALALLDFGFPLEPLSSDTRHKIARNLIELNRLDLVPLVDPKDELDKSDLEPPTGDNLFHRVAAFADIELLEYLYQKGIPFDTQSHRQFTPLILAAGYSNIPAVCWFLDKGAQIDHRNQFGHTALQYAIVKQQSEAAACLLEQGSDINLPGPKGVTPLMQAILFRDLKTAEAIMGAGGIWNLDSPYLDQCLEFALLQDAAETLQGALDQGLKPDRKLKHKWPLPWLCAYYQADKSQSIFGKTAIFHTPANFDPKRIYPSEQNTEMLNELFTKEELPRTLSLRCVIDPDGFLKLPLIQENVDRFVENEIRRLLVEMRIEREQLGIADPKTWYAVDFTLSFHTQTPSQLTSLFVERLIQLTPPAEGALLN